jgi:hypothetical protein
MYELLWDTPSGVWHHRGYARVRGDVLQSHIHPDALHPDGLGAPERHSAKSSLSGAFVCLDQEWSSAYPTSAILHHSPPETQLYGIAMWGRCLVMMSAPSAGAAPAFAPAVAAY